jgi:hypothetical protein
LALLARTSIRGGKVNGDQIGLYLSLCVLSVLAYALVEAERLNWITTYDSIRAMSGGQHIMGMDWSKTLAYLVVTVDIATLLAVFTPQSKFHDEPAIIRIVLALWAITVLTDMFGTWYFVRLQQESSVIRSPALIQSFTYLFPVAVTIMITGLQVGILRIFTLVLEMVIQGRIAKLFRKPQPKSPPPQPQYHPMSGRLDPMTGQIVPARPGQHKVYVSQGD